MEMDGSSLPNEDCVLVGISWPDSKSCELSVTLVQPNDERVTLRFMWVRDLAIRLELQKVFTGRTVKIQYEAATSGKDVRLDFGSTGEVSFACEEVELVRVDKL